MVTSSTNVVKLPMSYCRHIIRKFSITPIALIFRPEPLLLPLPDFDLLPKLKGIRYDSLNELECTVNGEFRWINKLLRYRHRSVAMEIEFCYSMLGRLFLEIINKYVNKTI